MDLVADSLMLLSNCIMLKFNVLQFNALIYNPIGRSHDIFMRFPVNSPQLLVTDDLGQRIMAQVNCTAVQVKINTSMPVTTVIYFVTKRSLLFVLTSYALTYYRLSRCLMQLLKPVLV